MKKMFYFLFKIWLILFSICSISYILFFNSPEEALKKFSLSDAIYYYMMTAGDSKEELEFVYSTSLAAWQPFFKAYSIAHCANFLLSSVIMSLIDS